MQASTQSLVPVGKPNVDIHKAQVAGAKANGSAVAINLIKSVEAEAGKLKRFLSDIFALTQEGRTQFRVTLKESLFTARAQAEELKGTPEGDMFNRMLRSAGVRVSECTTFSKAVDAGYVCDIETETYHSLVVGARMHLTAQSSLGNDGTAGTPDSVGPTVRRGRKAKALSVKIIEFLAANVSTDADMDTVRAAVAAYRK